MTTSILTPDLLRSLLHYNPDTGVFTYTRARPKIQVGAVAGHLHKGHGYIQLKVNGVLYLAHRLAWLYVHGEWPDGQIDHIDRNRTNNVFSNLRVVTGSQNAQNSDPQVNNWTGGKDVTWFKPKQRWVARISLNGDRVFLGSFKDKSDALAIRKFAESIMHTHSPA